MERLLKKGPSGRRRASRSSFIREEWIDAQLSKKQSEWTDTMKLSIFIATYNVNGKKPTEDLAPLLTNLSGANPDIYVIGFQEIVNLNTKNMVRDHQASDVWEEHIERALPRNYIKVCSRHLVGISLCIYVRQNQFQYMKNIRSCVVGVGIMGVGGNKGAAAIRLDFHDSPMCFVNAHMAARKKNVAARNAHYYALCKRLSFPGTDKHPEALTLFDHQHMFWLGDLNYRLNIKDLDLCYELVEKNDIDQLLTMDQLLIEKEAGNAFAGWQEGKVTFLPSYKFTPKTNEYDRRVDKKVRFPAWCDRIMWMGSGISQVWYQREETLCISDHKPVRALFEVGTSKVDPEKREKVQAQLGMQLDQWENESFPRVELDKSIFEFGPVRFDLPCVQTLTVKNVGSVVAAYIFAPKHKGDALCKQWLTITPAYGMIVPGEEIVIELTIQIGREHALPFQLGLESLEEILIFKLENGRDYFLSLTGSYAKSCFGTTVPYLVNTPAPVRYSELKSPPLVLSLPKELWRLVDFIYKNGLDEEGLFLTSGMEQEIEDIREKLDCGEELSDDVSVHSVAETLLRFLSSLAQPVLPPRLIEDSPEQGGDMTLWCTRIMMAMRPCYYNTFIYLTAFLHEVLKHSENNGINEQMLVVLFASCLTQADPGADGNERPRSWGLIRHFILNSL